jgi:amino acid transporter
MADTKTASKGSLKRELGLWALVALGVGAIIGSGIFVLPAIMGGVAGPSFIVAVVLVGIIVLILGLAYAELGSAYPMTGGPYSLPRKAMGNDTGFVLGFGYFIYAFTGTAAIIDVFITYLGYYVPGLVINSVLTPLGIGLALICIGIFTIINILGLKFGSEYAILTTLGKIIPLALFVIIGFMFFNATNFSPFAIAGFGGIELAMALDFFAFTGFESVVVPEGEVKNPGRNIPRAMVLSILIVVAVYVAISVAFTGMFNWGAAGLNVGDWTSGIAGLSSPLATAGASVGLPILAAIVVIGAIISTAGCGGDWILLQARIPYAMAKNKLFWSKLDDVNSKFGTPAKALIFASVLTGITMVLLPTFPSVALIASITTLVPYACAALALPILRKTDPKAKRPFKLPFAMFFAVAGFVLCTLLIYWASWPWTLVGCILMLVAYPLFLVFKEDKTIELKRNLWLMVYLVGIVAISLLGDPTFTYNNFLPIGPMGVLTSPYDAIVVVVFSLIIFVWGYLSNVKHEPLEDDLDNE